LLKEGITMAKPTVAVRVSPELYEEIFSIAEDRDVSMTEALNMLIYRLRREAEYGEEKLGTVEGGTKGGIKKGTRGKAKSPRAKPKKPSERLYTAEELAKA
jgi:hypothetical protein